MERKQKVFVIIGAVKINGTAPRTRAEGFYRKCGWKETGIHGKAEIKFEMSYERWQEMNGRMIK